MTGSSRAAAMANASESVPRASVTPTSASSRRPPAAGSTSGDEAGDDAGLAEPPDPVGRGVRAQADGGAEVLPGHAPVRAEQIEDLTVDRGPGPRFPQFSPVRLRACETVDSGDMHALTGRFRVRVPGRMQLGPMSLFLVRSTLVRGGASGWRSARASRSSTPLRALRRRGRGAAADRRRAARGARVLRAPWCWLLLGGGQCSTPPVRPDAGARARPRSRARAARSRSLAATAANPGDHRVLGRGVLGRARRSPDLGHAVPCSSPASGSAAWRG